jgi:hypothetical protein
MAVQLSFICCRITVWMWRRLGCSTYAVPSPFLDFSASNCIGRTRRYWKDGLRSGLRCMILASFRKRFRANARTCSQPYGGRVPGASKVYTLRHDSLGMLFWKDKLAERAADERWFGPQTEYYECGLDYWARAATGHHGQPHTRGSAFPAGAGMNRGWESPGRGCPSVPRRQTTAKGQLAPAQPGRSPNPPTPATQSTAPQWLHRLFL